MLHLMEESGSNANAMMVGPISLVRNTSALILIFNDRRPIKDMGDRRLSQMREILQWFSGWEDSSTKHNLMSSETRQDIKMLLSCFPSLCQSSLRDVHHAISPGYMNSDIIENIFSQQRGIYHGSNCNPNYMQYCYGTNSITLGQSVISSKSNAAKRKSGSHHGSLPFNQLFKKLRL